MHDAFMACVACEKVKTVELYNNSLYPLLTNTDAIVNKLIIDYACTDQAPAYTYSGSVVYLALNGHVLIGARLSADYIESLGNLIVSGRAITDLLSVPTRARVGGGNTQGGSDVVLDVGKLAKFLHTEFHAPLRLQYNGSQESPGRTPVVQVTSGTTFNLTVPPYDSYLDGECLRIVNMGGSTLTINGTASTDSIPPYRFGDVFRWNGSWYMER